MTYSHIRLVVNMVKTKPSKKSSTRAPAPFSDRRQRRSADIRERLFLAALTVRMTEEPARAPDVVRAILQAYLSTSTVRSAMRENQARGHGLLTQVVQLGQERGDFRRDLPAGELAQVFRQTVFGTLLMWSLFGDASLPERIHTALNVLWKGLAPRDAAAASLPPVSS